MTFYTPSGAYTYRWGTAQKHSMVVLTMTRSSISVEKANMVTLYQLYRKTIDILLNMIDHGSLAAEREAIKELVYDLRALERHSPHLFAKHAEMRIAQTRPKLRSGEPCFLVEFLLCLVPFMGPTLLEKYHNAKQPQSQRTMKVCNLGLFSERFKHSSFTGSLESLANMREDLQCAPQTSTMRN